MPTLDEIRGRAMRHQEELDRDTKFFTVADLAARWKCSKATVRAIPTSRLPYTNLGTGLKRELRRYRPDHVAAYETALEQSA
jgi:hypothetical protein